MDKNRECPYLGLKPFTYDDFDIYYYDKKTAHKLISLIAENYISMLVGFSGSGKTSFLKASFIPTLYSYDHEKIANGWEVVVTRPRANPFHELKVALSKYTSKGKVLEKKQISDDKNFIVNWFQYDEIDKRNKLIIIDQFEELFTQNNDLKSASDFVEMIINCTIFNNKTSIILVCRIDYLNSLSMFDELPELVTGSTLFIPKIKRNDLHDAIFRPALTMGKFINDNLVTLLKNRVFELRDKTGKDNDDFEEDDSLPLLQYFLMHMWNSFPNEQSFTTKHYDKIGPLEKVINRHLDHTFYFSKGASKKERDLTEFLFPYLARRDKKNPKRITRHPQEKRKIIELYESVHNTTLAETDLDRIIQKYSAKAVGVLKINEEDGKLDVVHEAVFRQWKYCYTWITKKNERYEKLGDLLNNTEKPLRSHDEVKEILLNEKYFKSEGWFKEFYEDYYGKKVNEYDENFEKKKQEKDEIVKRLNRLRLMYAIKRADFNELNQILDHNEAAANNLREDDLIYLLEDELTDKEFNEEFFYAIYPGFAEYNISQSNRENKENLDGYFNKASEMLSKKKTISEIIQVKPTADQIKTRWEQKWKQGQDQKSKKKDFFEKLKTSKYSKPDDNSKDYYLHHFAAFAGQKGYLKALFENCYEGYKEPGIYCIPKEEKNVDDKHEQLEISRKVLTAFDMCIIGEQLDLAKEIFDRYTEEEKGHALKRTCFSSGRSPLHIAAINNNHDEIEWILETYEKIHGDNDILKKGDNLEDIPLHLASFSSSKDISECFLSQEQITAKNKVKRTPFSYACWFKSEKMIDKLLSFAIKKGFVDSILEINKQTRDKEDKDYLFLAMSNVPDGFDQQLNNKSFFVLDRLLNHKTEGGKICSQLNIPDNNKGTLLHYAVKYFKSFDIIKLLLDKGTDPNVFDRFGFTPIDFAVTRGDLNILKLILCSKKIEVTQEVKDKAAKYAFESSKFEMYEMLGQYGSDYRKPFAFAWKYADFIKENFDDNESKELFESRIELSGNASWIVSSLFSSCWTKLEHEKSKEYLNRIYENYFKTKHGSSFNFRKKPVFKGVRSCDLPFYDKTKLIEVNIQYEDVQNGGSQTSYFVIVETIIGGQPKLTLLNGTSPSIHQLNEELPIRLSKYNVYNYLKFFCTFVHGEEGAFNIIDEIDQIHWLEDAERKKCNKFIQFVLNKDCTEPEEKKEDDNVFWSCRTLVKYSHALFLANWRIKASGMIEMQNDLPIIANLSSNTEIFEDGLRTYREIRSEEDEELDIIPFISAAKEGLLGVMNWKLEQDKGLNINDVTKRSKKKDTKIEESNDKEVYEKTALRLAAENVHIHVVEWLLSLEGIEDRKASDGKTAQDLANESKNKKLINLFQNYNQKPTI
ncbi:MAG: hypothetical protein D8M57_19375 [Candidatus Scalindua sp. AMX11]|nr:hypothetical protein [Planctomycetota bacterium]RZV61479.1 MAG: hypothetical protein EX341_18850 [Candidatus Scalindua sp. SCAELEC01]TDE63234.1 MAG: hypothetical protein D8M57_19375 [Candidatus Scalindua sp. AMX11]